MLFNSFVFSNVISKSSGKFFKYQDAIKADLKSMQLFLIHFDECSECELFITTALNRSTISNWNNISKYESLFKCPLAEINPFLVFQQNI